MSFKHAVKHAIRAGSTPPRGKPFRTRTHDLGLRPGVNLDKALQLAGEFEDQEIVRKLQRGK